MQPRSHSLRRSIQLTCYCIFILAVLAAATGTGWIFERPTPFKVFVVIGALCGLCAIAALVLSNVVLNQVALLEYRVQTRLGRVALKPAAASNGKLSLDRGVVDVVMDEAFASAWRRHIPAMLRRVTDYSLEPRTYLLAEEFHDLESVLSKSRVADMAMQSIKQDLFQHFSHQLKTPMAVILSHLEGARDALENSDEGALVSAMDGVEAACRSASTLVEQLLSLAYVQGLERRGLTPQLVDASVPVADAVASREYLARKRSLMISAEINGDTWVAGETALIQELVACLLDNCISYVEEGGNIEVTCAQVQDGVEIVIQDDGPGVPSSERERVLQAFYGQIGQDGSGRTIYGIRRRHAVTANSKASHGLGLSLVASIVALHKGRVELNDRPDGLRGLRVTCHFPAAKAH